MSLRFKQGWSVEDLAGAVILTLLCIALLIALVCGAIFIIHATILGLK